MIFLLSVSLSLDAFAIAAAYALKSTRIPMISKLVVFGNDREEATARMRRALAEYLFEGVITNVDYQIELLSTEAFRTGEFHNNFLDEYNKRRNAAE